MKLRTLHSVRAMFALACMAVFVTGCTNPETDDPKPVTPPSAAIELGRVTETEIEIKLSAQNADKMAYCVVEATDALVIPEASAIFEMGELSQAFETPEAFEILDLKPGTAYTVYAAASKGDLFSEVVKVDATTEMPAVHELITDVAVSDLSVSYNIDLPEGCTCYHTYVEKWFYDYELMMAMYTAGPEFDKNLFMYSLLAQIGIQSEVSGQAVWTAGEEHPTRRTVSLTPGKEYYVIAAALENYAWSGDATLIPFTMPAAKGVSAENIELSIDNLTFDSVTLRMACDENKVAFFFYNLFEKEEFDKAYESLGDRGMMDFLFEYNGGHVSGNTYTDKWIVDAGSSYVLAVYGIDYNACEIYKELQVDVPVQNPTIVLDVVPYERELQGYHDYDTFMLTFEPLYFENALNTDRVWCSSMPMEKSMFDQYIAMMFGISGMSLEQLEQMCSQPEVFYQLYMYLSMFYVNPIYDDAEIASLTKNGYFERIFTDLNADTEYVVIGIAYDGETPIVRIVSAKTAAEPAATAASDGYKAYLGNWTVTGQTTADWSTYETYNLRIEELTPNRSFKVYGWSHSTVSQEFPFEMRYHPETGKVSIEGPQILGTKTLDDMDMAVEFAGKMYISGRDELVGLLGYNGPIYTGGLNGDNLSLFSEILKIGGRDKEFMSMNYSLHYGDEYFYVEGDESDLIYFRITRAAASAASVKGVSPLRPSTRKVGSLPHGELRASLPVLSSVVKVPVIRDGKQHNHARLHGVAQYAASSVK